MIGILQMSGTAAVLIAAILLLRRLFFERLPKRTFKLLWVVAAARMLIPFSAPILPQTDTARQGTAQTIIMQNQHRADGKTAAAKADEPQRSAFAELCEKRRLEAIWLCGTALIFTGFAVSHAVHKKKYAASLPCRSRSVTNYVNSFGFRRRIVVKISDEVTSPLTYGALKPVIILPQSALTLSVDKQKHILAHEVMHVAKFDILLKWVMISAVSLNWFNPLAWVMLVMADRDIELCCDEAVLKNLDGGRKAYAMTLIDMEEQRVPVMFAGFGSSSVKERIVAIMKFKKTTLAAAAVSICLIAGSMSVFAMERADKSDGLSEVERSDMFAEVTSDADTLKEADEDGEQSETTYTTEMEVNDFDGEIYMGLPGEESDIEDEQSKVKEQLAEMGVTVTDNGEYIYHGKTVSGLFVDVLSDSDESCSIFQMTEEDGGGVYLVSDKEGGLKEVSKEEFEDTFKVGVVFTDAVEDSDGVVTEKSYSYTVDDETEDGTVNSSDYRLVEDAE